MKRALYSMRGAGMILSEQVHVYDPLRQVDDHIVPRCVKEYGRQVSYLDESLAGDDDLLMSLCDATWRLADALRILEGWKLITCTWLDAALALYERSVYLVEPFVDSCKGLFKDAIYFALPRTAREAAILTTIHPEMTVSTSYDLDATLRKIGALRST